MILPFTIATSRAADDLRADLEACRSLRHVSPSDREGLVKFFFGDIEHSLREGKKLPGTGRFFVWTWEAFEEAFSAYGYSCDVCGTVTAVPESRWRYVADRALSNLDGLVQLMLCRTCGDRFSVFCQRHFQREARVLYSRELEQMMLAFIANEVGREARRILSGKPERRRGGARHQTGDRGTDRATVPSGSDGQRDCTIDWREPQHGSTVSEGLRR